ncbi:cytochrome P450 [Streptomonospora litoralis]|uniref:Vitamin D(3) 25-hydroxylase n=1 Tax=Streptomonospora litoralis TaxID=2498135 RepID=A0A4P6Q953_9ACTN|nr:cytochrome P450 [Streptomonospora litoralis]QBI56121.1 Vitamin D(3) 25-hydroxylase [Streptomonospora litoralis]
MAAVELAGLHLWAACGDEALRTVQGDISGTFLRGAENWPALQRGEIDRTHPLVALVGDLRSLLALNGTEHEQIRRLLRPAFTPAAVKHRRPQIEAITDRLLDEMEAAGPRADLLDFAWQLTVEVFLDLFGLGPEHAEKLTDITTRAFALSDPGVHAEARAYIADLLDHTPPDTAGGELLSLLATSQRDGDVSRADAIDTCYLLIVAGFDTTLGALLNAAHALAAHSDQRDLVQSGEVSWSEAVEECLRRYSSVATLPIVFTTREVELCGTELPAGAGVLLGISAAGLDPHRWHDPEVFDVTRNPKGHLAFGHGIHYCLGAHLARLELETALSRLFTRFPHLDVAGPVPPLPSFMIRRPAGLPVNLNPGTARAA